MSSNFVWFNFRGKVRFLRKDTVQHCPYLYTLANLDGKFCESEKDKDGFIMVDEDYKSVIALINGYIFYLETNEARYSRLNALVASRLGFDRGYIKAMENIDQLNSYAKRSLREAAKGTAKIDNLFKRTKLNNK